MSAPDEYIEQGSSLTGQPLQLDPIIQEEEKLDLDQIDKEPELIQMDKMENDQNAEEQKEDAVLLDEITIQQKMKETTKKESISQYMKAVMSSFH